VKVTEADLANLKQLYKSKYGIMLTEEEVNELARRLLLLFGVIGKKIPDNKI